MTNKTEPDVIRDGEEPQPRGVGRPSSYTQEIADQICERLAGGESLRQILRDEGMRPTGTVFRWLNDRRSFRDQYEHARDVQADVMADEITDIADDGSNDWMQRETEKGRLITVIDHEHVQRSRLRVDARKWVASKLKPKKYGDRIEVDNKYPIEELSDAQIQDRIALLQKVVLQKAESAQRNEKPSEAE